MQDAADAKIICYLGNLLQRVTQIELVVRHVASIVIRHQCSVCECCHVHHARIARLQRRHSPYMRVQRPGFALLKAGNRALASIEFITQRATRRSLLTTLMT